MAKAGGNSTPSDGKLSEQHWRAIEKTLPAAANLAFVQAELERIKRDTLSSEDLAKRFEALARESEHLAQESPVTEKERAQLEKSAQLSRELAKHHARLVGERRKFRKQAAILLLWQTQGGGDPKAYTHGKAAIYLQAASLAVFGQDLSAEGAKAVIEKFRKKNFSTAVLSATGTMSVRGLLFDEHGNLVEDDAERISPGSGQ
jgi:hypothetical protein